MEQNKKQPRQLVSKPLKVRKDTQVSLKDKKSVKQAKKRARYYFLSLRQRKELKNVEGRNTAINSLESTSIVLSFGFINYFGVAVSLGLHELRTLFFFVSRPDCVVTYNDWLSCVLLVKNAGSNNSFVFHCRKLVNAGYIEKVDYRSYRLLPYSLFVLDTVLKDYKKLNSDS